VLRRSSSLFASATLLLEPLTGIVDRRERWKGKASTA
jgi:hypothetical protein